MGTDFQSNERRKSLRFGEALKTAVAHVLGVGQFGGASGTLGWPLLFTFPPLGWFFAEFGLLLFTPERAWFTFEGEACSEERSWAYLGAVFVLAGVGVDQLLQLGNRLP
jgi:hypothetical protein